MVNTRKFNYKRKKPEEPSSSEKDQSSSEKEEKLSPKSQKHTDSLSTDGCITDQSYEEYSDSVSSIETEFQSQTEDILEKISNNDLLENSEKKRYKQIISIIREFIKINQPTLLNIINEPLLLEDKVKLIRLYEIWKSEEPLSEEYVKLEDTIIKEFNHSKLDYKEYCRYTDEEHREMEILRKEITMTDNFNISLERKILLLNTSSRNKAVIYRKYEEYKEHDNHREEKIKLKYWLEYAITLPYDNVKYSNIENLPNKDILLNVYDKLNDEMYGMINVKEQILLFLNAKLNNPNMKQCSLGLIGSPGTGKTRISKLLAEILDLPFSQISFGGINKVEYLKGHDYTYIGSQPGAIAKSLKEMRYKNGIMFFDEYEKGTKSPEIAAALLHITDPNQNKEFHDLYLGEIDIDLSNLWFIYSMNKLPEDNALRDRIFLINVDDYTFDEKVKITKDYILPRILRDHNKQKTDITITRENTKKLLKNVNKNKLCLENKGLRAVEFVLDNIIKKLDLLVNIQDENGKITNFDLTFNYNKKISYPLELTEELLDIVLEPINDNLYNMMYI